MSEKNKRYERDPRVARSFTVRINEHVSDGTPRWDIVFAKNISASGILFNFDHYLEPGSRVQFKIALPFCGHVECEGEVVRNVMGRPRGSGSKTPTVCAVAAVFRDIAEQDVQAMREFFERHAAAEQPEQTVSPKEFEGEKIPRAKRIARQFITRIQRENSDSWELVPVQNLSSSGMLFNYSEPMEVDAELTLKIVLPFLSDPVLSRGHVVRVQDQSRPGALRKVYGIAVQFSEFDETVKQQLHEYAEQVGCE